MSLKQAKQMGKNRVLIGSRLRALRERRRWTQAELAARLSLSQPRLSHVERGEASLSAEQFLEALRIFNVPATAFVSSGDDDAMVDLQNALARLGAASLRVSDGVLPSERLARVHDVVFETLVSGSPRFLTALAPVLVNNADALNLARLSVELDGVGLRRRLYWVIENTLAALEDHATPPGSRTPSSYRPAARRLQTALAFADGYDQVIAGAVDLLDPSIRSKQSVEEVRRSSSEISKKWGIVTGLQPADFAAALRAARAGD